MALPLAFIGRLAAGSKMREGMRETASSFAQEKLNSLEIKVESNAKLVEKRLKKQATELTGSMKKALSITAQHGVNVIEDRTEDSKGYKGGKFKRYTKKYAKFRSSKGRGKKPDLNFSGKMLGSMTTKAKKTEAKIFFTRAAEAKKAGMNNKTRPFFGFSRKEEKQLGKVFFRYLK